MENCGLLEPPKLNPLLKQIVTKRILDRDDRMILKQNRFKTCLVGVTNLLSLLLAIRERDKSYDPTIQVLCDLGRQCADGFYEENCIRKYFIIKDIVDTDWKPLLKDIVSHEYLFGADLEDKIAAFRNLTKAAAELKPKPVTPMPKNLQAPPRPPFPKSTGGGQPKQFHQQCLGLYARDPPLCANVRPGQGVEPPAHLRAGEAQEARGARAPRERARLADLAGQAVTILKASATVPHCTSGVGGTT